MIETKNNDLNIINNNLYFENNIDYYYLNYNFVNYETNIIDYNKLLNYIMLINPEYNIQDIYYKEILCNIAKENYETWLKSSDDY